MSSEPSSQAISESQQPSAGSAEPVLQPNSTSTAVSGVLVSRGAFYVFLAVAALALTASVLLWQKLSNIQEQLARQSQESGTQAIEARTLARQALESVRETAARLALAETRLSEVAMQRSQVEELVQSMSRSRDENILVDIESGLRLAQQQAQLTGSVEPLLAALRSADQRLERAGQARLSRVRAAVARDTERVKASGVTDVPGLLVKLDDLARQVDDLPLANAVSHPGAAALPSRPASAPVLTWWERALTEIRGEARSLVRVSRIDEPEAVLLAPDQSFFLRENLKLKLLNARLALLGRQTESAYADVTTAGAALRKYFDASSRKTQAAVSQLQQVQSQLKIVELPRIDETLAVLATAAAGR